MRYGRGDGETTRGWSIEFRQKVLRAVDTIGLEAACKELKISRRQVGKLVARERHMVAHRAINWERREFLERVEKKAQEGLMVALERGLEAVDKEGKNFGKLGKLTAEVLKGTGMFQPEAQVNVQQIIAEIPIDWREFYRQKEKGDAETEPRERRAISDVEGGAGKEAGG